MATRHVSMLGPQTAVGPSGSVYFAPYDATVGTGNDLFKHLVAVFDDSGTDIYLYGAREIPQDYVGTLAFKVAWASDNNIATGKVVWGLSYSSVAAGESCDPASFQQSVLNAAGTTVAGTADFLNVTAIGSPTAGNLAAGDILFWRLERLGSDADDTMGARALVVDLIMEYADA